MVETAERKKRVDVLEGQFLAVDEVDESIKVDSRRDHDKGAVESGIVWIRNEGLFGERVGLVDVPSWCGLFLRGGIIVH